MVKLDLDSYRTNSKKVITHQGIVSNILNSTITVALKGDVHCEGCKAKAACGVSESNSKEIEVFNSNTSLNLNEEVTVFLQKSTGFKAVFWAYMCPFLILIFILLIASSLFKEWLAGLLALASLIPYYLILYFLKNSFKNTFKVSIVKNN